jgi:RNA polymerase sigma-70 factor (ECF subfamily)
MDRTDRNFSQSSGDAERSVAPDYLSPDEEDSEPAAESHSQPIRDSFEDLGSTHARQSSRSRPDAALGLHGRMSEAMSAALFEQIAVERSEIAFKEFYDFLAPKVYSVIYRIVHSEDDALDLLQEVFTHFWNTAPELYKVHSNISAWILLLARNRAVDEALTPRIRSQSQTESYDTLEHEHLMADTHAPDEKITAEGASLEIRAAFEVLSLEQRRIMELVFFSGIPMKTVAETVQISHGAVRKAVHDALKKLRQVMKPEDALQLQMDKPPRKISKKSEVVTQSETIEVKAVEEEKKVPEPIKAAETQKIPQAKKVTPVKKAAKIQKAPKEKVIKETSGIKKETPTIKRGTHAEGKSLRSRKLHSLLDDLIKSRQDVLNTTSISDQPTSSTIENT